MQKYGIGDRLYKAIHGQIQPGGTQYQTFKKEEVKVEPGQETSTPRKKGREKKTTATTDTHL